MSVLEWLVVGVVGVEPGSDEGKLCAEGVLRHDRKNSIGLIQGQKSKFILSFVFFLAGLLPRLGDNLGERGFDKLVSMANFLKVKV